MAAAGRRAGVGGLVGRGVRRDPGRRSALQVTWTCCAIGALFCLPAAPALVRELGKAPAQATAWLVFLGVFPTSVAFTTWAYALARGSAGRVATTAYLVPPIAIVM